MSNHYQLTAYTLFADPRQVDEQVHLIQDYVAGISHERGLLAMVKNNPITDSTTAPEVINILLDDMSTNLSASQIDVVRATPSEFARNCLQESVDNINEFLHFQRNKNQILIQDGHASLATVQYFQGYISYIIMAGFSILLLRQDNLSRLTPVTQKSAYLLGKKPIFEGQVQSQSVRQGDIFIMAPTDAINTLGTEYLRKIFCFFPDSIDSALHQIKREISGKYKSRQPSLIIARVDPLVTQKRSWLKKLGRR